jgi:hypothetical protein
VYNKRSKFNLFVLLLSHTHTCAFFSRFVKIGQVKETTQTKRGKKIGTANQLLVPNKFSFIYFKLCPGN